MSFLDKLKARSEQAVEVTVSLSSQIASQVSNTVEKAKEVVNTVTAIVDEEKRNNRYEICKSCPEFIELTAQCKKCGCFMKAKTAFEAAQCPLNKW